MIDTKFLDKLMSALPVSAWSPTPMLGRYFSIGKRFIPYCSEYALMEARFLVEIEWVLMYSEKVEGECVPEGERDKLMGLRNAFSPEIYQNIKKHEKICNHDVKSVEFAIGNLFAENGLERLIPFIHIGLTSEDTNNLAYAILWKRIIWEQILPAEKQLIDKLAFLTEKWAGIPMLAYTHGQAATPTTLGKELAVFVDRLARIYNDLRKIEIEGKLNGATGNHAALRVAHPHINWEDVSKQFVEERIGVKWRRISTQVEPHDFIYKIMTNIAHFASIVRKLDTDLWFYNALKMIKQRVVAGEVGSSTMPHKVNPIMLENSEGHIKLLIGEIFGFVMGLMESRMQRDLSDSCMQRYPGEALMKFCKALEQTTKFLDKIDPDRRLLLAQLKSNWQVLAEAIQTCLRAMGVRDAYNRLKSLTRGKEINREDIMEFVLKSELHDDPIYDDTFAELTPQQYTGYACNQAVDTANAWFAGEYFT